MFYLALEWLPCQCGMTLNSGSPVYEIVHLPHTAAEISREETFNTESAHGIFPETSSQFPLGTLRILLRVCLSRFSGQEFG